MFDAPKKRRRRRLVWPLLISVVIVVSVLVATAGGDARSTITYLEDVQTTARQIARAGSTLETLVGDLSRVDRTEFESVVEGVRTALDDAGEVAANRAPDDELLGAMTLYRLAVEAWRQGVDGFADAIYLAADEPNNESVVDDVASAVVSVRAGDDIYGALVAEFDREEVPSPVGEMPEVRLLPIDAPITVIAPAWVEAVRSEASGLAIRPSIRIEQVTTKPEMVQSADSQIVVPAVADTIDVMVVVGNSGNTATGEATLQLTFTGGEGEPVVESAAVPPIEPGASTSVPFRELAVTPGVFYELLLELDPEGPDLYQEDNRYSTGFAVNEATPTTDTTSSA